MFEGVKLVTHNDENWLWPTSLGALHFVSRLSGAPFVTSHQCKAGQFMFHPFVFIADDVFGIHQLAGEFVFPTEELGKVLPDQFDFAPHFLLGC